MANDETTFDYVCPLDQLGRPAEPGSPVARCGFTSTGWLTAEEAEARGAEHEAEHASKEPMPELADHTQGDS